MLRCPLAGNFEVVLLMNRPCLRPPTAGLVDPNH